MFPLPEGETLKNAVCYCIRASTGFTRYYLCVWLSLFGFLHIIRDYYGVLYLHIMTRLLTVCVKLTSDALLAYIQSRT